MLNPKETDEKKHLDKVEERLNTALTLILRQIEDYANDTLNIKRYLYQNLAQFDAAEKAANRMAVSDNITFGEKAVKERERLQKLILSPYFGRIDFTEAGEQSEPFYIGVHSFVDPATSYPVIFDWRAPISSIFYDFEVGPAFYIAPMGRIEGALTLKRQYKIRQSQMEYMIESSLNIGDELLQKELSQSSDDKMKNIVATIQREQNAIIRNEAAKVLIIQGAAGSGKTSIALHRVAFLLYRYRDTLNANNVMIISPNKVFGNYISNVLPELGEENISELSFDDIAANILAPKYRYQTFFEQVESLMAANDTESIVRIEFKATNLFVEQLQSYLEQVNETCFIPTDLAFGDFYVSKEELLSHYLSLEKLPVKKRLRTIADNLIEKYYRNYNKKINAAVSRQIRSSIQQMFQFSDTLALYKQFYRSIGQDDLFRPVGKNIIEFCDVYPLIYTQLYFEGLKQDYKSIQHLLVDEMQDYTPVQYAVLARLFSCKMTILGDSYQSVNPYSSSSAEKIEPYFAGCSCMELCRSYRSTIEITRFTQRILENKKLIPIERHGEAPTITECPTQQEQLDKILQLIEEFQQSGYASLGIICKSQQQAKLLREQLYAVHKDITLLNFESREFREGIIIASVHMSKGLEFDQVIVPDASDGFYQTQLERSLLYIACTRAMHKLTLVCWGKATRFLA